MVRSNDAIGVIVKEPRVYRVGELALNWDGLLPFVRYSETRVTEIRRSEVRYFYTEKLSPQACLAMVEKEVDFTL